jgi:hypothetical protein
VNGQMPFEWWALPVVQAVHSLYRRVPEPSRPIRTQSPRETAPQVYTQLLPLATVKPKRQTTLMRQHGLSRPRRHDDADEPMLLLS